MNLQDGDMLEVSQQEDGVAQLNQNKNMTKS